MKQIYYAWKSMSGTRGSNIVKVVSVAVGLLASVIIFSRLAFNLTFDTGYADHERIYQLWMQWDINGKTGTPGQRCLGKLAGGVLEALPDQVESATTGAEHLGDVIYRGDRGFRVTMFAADSLFFDTMGIEVVSGDAVRDLAVNDVVYLSENTAKWLFGDTAAVGQTLRVGNGQIELTVKGIYRDVNPNSSMKPDALVSLPTLWSRGIGYYSWGGGDSWLEYVRLREGHADLDEINRRVQKMFDEHCPPTDAMQIKAWLAPLTDTYRNSAEVKRMTLILTILGFAILFVTALNYVLISVASLSRRAKAVGVHKCSGAGAGTVFGMFMWETAMLLGMSVVLGAVLLYVTRDLIQQVIGLTPGMMFGDGRWMIVIIVLAVFMLIGGVLPGRVFARIPVTQVFRRFSERKNPWKRVLLAVEFAGVAFVAGLLMTTILQYHEVTTHGMGFRTERMAVLGSRPFYNSKNCATAYDLVAKLPYVEAVTGSESIPLWGYSGAIMPDSDGKPQFSTRYDHVMPNYFDVLEIPLLDGRWPTSEKEAVVNETFARLMHWGDEVVGRVIPQTEFYNQMNIVGLIRDFHIGSFYDEPMPYTAFMNKNDSFYWMLEVKLKEPFRENLARLNADVTAAFPGEEKANFIAFDDIKADRYNGIIEFRNSVLLAAVVIVFITLMGLIGYTRDEVQRRSKEIAIRKVNGAGAGAILELLGTDVVKVAVPSVIAGTVAAWWIGRIFLSEFTVTSGFITGGYIITAIVVTALIMACVLGQTWKVANSNPVISLKSE